MINSSQNAKHVTFQGAANLVAEHDRNEDFVVEEISPAAAKLLDLFVDIDAHVDFGRRAAYPRRPIPYPIKGGFVRLTRPTPPKSNAFDRAFFHALVDNLRYSGH